MKKIICRLAFILIAINLVFATESTIHARDTIPNSSHQNIVQKKSITVGAIFTHFSPTNNDNGLEYSTELITPGIEAKFCYAISNTVSLSTGINYQYNKITYRYDDPSIKTITNEIAIPLLINLNLFQNKTSGLQLSSGFYLGQYLSIIDYNRVSWNDKTNYAKLFSTDDFIADIYFAIGKNKIHKKVPFGVDLFFRYRLKEHSFVNFYVNRAFYGIKIKYAFNL